MSRRQVVIVGAGLAGLSCALSLQNRGVNCRILERDLRVGGRVRTHAVRGYLLDEGFQVLLSAYPITQNTLEYSELGLRSFYSGAKVRLKRSFYTLGDPTRRINDAPATLMAPVGSLFDKLRMLRMRKQITSCTLDELMCRPEVTTEHRLQEYGFSNEMIERFFRPFLGGVFLEPNLITSSRKFEFVMRMFSKGKACLPKRGMQAIPEQLADRLKDGVVQLGCHVISIDGNTLTLETGERIDADTIVLATPDFEAGRLQSNPKSIGSAGVTCLYYSADASPVEGPWLVLNGSPQGPINNLCVPTQLHPGYAPDGKSLISVTVLGVPGNVFQLEKEVRHQLTEWYGNAVNSWEHLQTFPIPEAITLQHPPALEIVNKPVKLADGLFACGDYLSITSIEGAISTGIRCADQICG